MFSELFTWLEPDTTLKCYFGCSLPVGVIVNDGNLTFVPGGRAVEMKPDWPVHMPDPLLLHKFLLKPLQSAGA